jgi:hypothetical protein
MTSPIQKLSGVTLSRCNLVALERHHTLEFDGLVAQLLDPRAGGSMGVLTRTLTHIHLRCTTPLSLIEQGAAYLAITFAPLTI